MVKLTVGCVNQITTTVCRRDQLE